MENKAMELEENVTVNEESKKTAPKKAAPVKKESKKYGPNDLIECRSVTGGGLILVGTKSQLQYEWEDHGDTAYVEFQDLQALQSRKSGFLVKPRFIIEDEELVEQWGSMLKPIYNKINNQDIEEFFGLDDPGQFKKILSKMPDGIKDSVKTKAAQKIASGELYDVRLVKIIDELLGTEFTATLLG
jgi:hypothetical protein